LQDGRGFHLGTLSVALSGLVPRLRCGRFRAMSGQEPGAGDRAPVPRIGAAEAARLGDALAFAAEHHGRQARKGTHMPYTSHLLQVAGLVLEHGGDLDQAIAGLLHDLVEDCAGVRVEDVAARFGARVAAIVSDCTDTLEGDTPARKSPWSERKRHYIEHMAVAAEDSVLVSACDKRHNLGAMVADLRVEGAVALERFSRGAQDQLWFYRSFLATVRSRLPVRLRDELEHLVDEFAVLVNGE